MCTGVACTKLHVVFPTHTYPGSGQVSGGEEAHLLMTAETPGVQPGPGEGEVGVGHDLPRQVGAQVPVHAAVHLLPDLPRPCMAHGLADLPASEVRSMTRRTAEITVQQGGGVDLALQVHAVSSRPQRRIRAGTVHCMTRAQWLCTPPAQTLGSGQASAPYCKHLDAQSTPAVRGRQRGR